MSAVRFGDPIPVDRTAMAYAGRAACGHVRWYVRDDGTTSSASEALDHATGLEVVERTTLAIAIRDQDECDRCHVEQPGLGP